MKRRWQATALLAGLCACRESPGVSPSPGASTIEAASSVAIAQEIYDGTLKNGWREEVGSRDAGPLGPSGVDFSKGGSWTLVRAAPPSEPSAFGGVTFRMKMPPGEGEFLEVRLGGAGSSTFPAVKLGPDDRRDLPGGWVEVLIPMSALDPQGLPFDRVTLHAFREVADGHVQLAKLALAAPTSGQLPGRPSQPSASAVAAAPGRPVSLSVDCSAVARPIDPMIYGIAMNVLKGADDPASWGLGATVRRWGGNTTSRYNWELGNAWNTGQDWFYENVKVTSYGEFLAADAAHNVKSVLTVPTLGWVAKDTTSFSFPVSMFGAQQATDQYRADAGNGKRPNGSLIPPKSPTMTSVPSTPDSIRRWVEAIRKADGATGKRSVDQYILDNETALWHETHRDVHPDPTTYDELLEKTIAYATAIRAADPDAVIAGPAAWGWPEYFYSAKDSAIGLRLRPDRRLHGDVPLLAWWLQKLKEHDQKTGTQLVNVVDVHFYPQAKNVFADNGDPGTAALRLRQTRGLWDPTYVDESWINDTIMLLPRLKKWIDEDYPGRKISIGEYNFGGESHMSGALAEAEALGRFGQEGVSSAFYWTYPKADSPVVMAFRAYRDFDGKGGRFLDYTVPTGTTLSRDFLSAFASRDADGTHMVVVLLNLSPDSAAQAKVRLDGCGPLKTEETYSYAGGPVSRGLAQQPPGPPGSAVALEPTLPAYSITVLDIHLQHAAPGRVEK